MFIDTKTASIDDESALFILTEKRVREKEIYTHARK